MQNQVARSERGGASPFNRTTVRFGARVNLGTDRGRGDRPTDRPTDRGDRPRPGPDAERPRPRDGGGAVGRGRYWRWRIRANTGPPLPSCAMGSAIQSAGWGPSIQRPTTCLLWALAALTVGAYLFFLFFPSDHEM